MSSRDPGGIVLTWRSKVFWVWLMSILTSRSRICWILMTSWSSNGDVLIIIVVFELMVVWMSPTEVRYGSWVLRIFLRLRHYSPVEKLASSLIFFGGDEFGVFQQTGHPCGRVFPSQFPLFSPNFSIIKFFLIFVFEIREIQRTRFLCLFFENFTNSDRRPPYIDTCIPNYSQSFEIIEKNSPIRMSLSRETAVIWILVFSVWIDGTTTCSATTTAPICWMVVDLQ